MNKVLWITTFFPPRINVGTIRNIKLLKYLPSYGWEAVVASPKEEDTNTEMSRHLLSQLSTSITQADMPRDPFLRLLDGKKGGKFAKYLGYLANNIIPPDGHIFWGLLTLRRLGSIIEEQRPSLIYTTCGPFSINLMGAWAKSRYGLPWVTDFRDLWTFNPFLRKKNPYFRTVSHVLERRYLAYCNAVVVNTDNSRRKMAERYPFIEEKIWVVQNGFDSEDMPLFGEMIKPTAGSFLYAGSIYKSRYTPYPILQLLQRLASAAGELYLEKTWEIHYAGENGNTFEEIVRQSGIKAKCITHGCLDQKALYILARKMSYVLLCMPPDTDSTSWLPARLYDYLGNKCRIICLSPRNGEIVEILQRYGNALLLFYDETPEVQTAKLKSFLDKKSERESMREQTESFVMNFERKALTGRLANVFQHCLDTERPRVRSL